MISTKDVAPPGLLGSPLVVEHDWWADAHCNGGDGQFAALFFSDELGDIAKAKRICAECPVLVPCLEGAMERREPWGVWGGQLFIQGVVVPRKRPRGRPRKNEVAA
jgi:WhiB family redox-sensing transcriptional regulator